MKLAQQFKSDELYYVTLFAINCDNIILALGRIPVVPIYKHQIQPFRDWLNNVLGPSLKLLQSLSDHTPPKGYEYAHDLLKQSVSHFYVGYDYLLVGLNREDITRFRQGTDELVMARNLLIRADNEMQNVVAKHRL